MADLLPALMFPVLFAMIFLGVPVAFALLLTAFLFGWHVFGDVIGAQMYGRLFDVIGAFALTAVPLFVFMGAVLERSGLAERLFEALQLWIGRLRGGLALATVGVGAVFAAASGIVGAVEAVIGMMTIPAMMARGYDKRLISGTICASGSLGTVIPPSILAVVYASLAQMSAGQVMASLMVPGLLMVALFCAYIVVRCAVWPEDGPAAAKADDVGLSEKLVISLKALAPPALLVAAVLGSILGGIASPTEAAAVGALGALLLAAVNGRLSAKVLTEAVGRTVRITVMILFIVVGGMLFSGVFMVNGGTALIRDVADALQLGPIGLVLVFLAVVFILGFFLEWISILIIVLPTFDPLVRAAGVDPLWFAVLVMITLQTSYLTPPMAPAVFYLRSIAPKEIALGDMFRGVPPFIACQIATLLLVALFPALATWMPALLY